MSPEQATGERELDARSDMYSLGAITYEMLVGEPPHTGNTVQAIIAKVLSAEPQPVSRVRHSVPSNVDAAVMCALAKIPADRFGSGAEYVGALTNPEFAIPSSAGVQATGSRGAKVWQRLAIVAFAVAGLLAVTTILGLLRPITPAEVSRWAVNLPPDQQLAVSHFDHPLAISPDGRQIAFVTEHQGVRQLYLHGMDEFQARAIPGTEDASNPFFSPDGQNVAFFSQGELRRVSVAGGRPILICDASGLGLGGSWGANDTIVFALLNEGLRWVPASGGATEELDAPDLQGYMVWPRHLPGRAELLVTASSRAGFRIAVVSLESGEVRVLDSLGEAIAAAYLPTKHLVYSQAGVLWAVSFDIGEFEPKGVPIALLDSIATSPGGSAAYFAVSDVGSLAYVPARSSDKKLVWVNREGQVMPILTDRADFHGPQLSPDGRRLVGTISDEGSFDLWVYDVERGTRTRLPSDYQAHDAVWTPDGTQIAYISFEGLNGDLALRPADGTGVREILLTQEHQQAPFSWSPDGETLAFYDVHPETGRDIWILQRDGEARPFVRTLYEDRFPSFSPDGRWIAYVSNESGRDEVYVAPYPGPGGKTQVSQGGGRGTAWSRDGELFYRNGDRMMSVRVRTEPSVVVDTPTMLFQGSFYAESAPNGTRDFSVSPDGQRFVMIQSEPATEFYVVLNWIEELKQRVGNGND
jgi:serine/threonine-protein kinase